jgi:hypothetical protein
MKASPCICCGLEFADAYGPNQPADGLGFHSQGAYGTTLFDPMDGSSIAINVCDGCLAAARDKGWVVFYEAVQTKPPCPRNWRSEG